MNPAGVRLPGREEDAAPVTILDGRGAVVRIVSAAEFRQIYGITERPTIIYRRRRSERVKTSQVEQNAIETAIAS
jgi:hypothetical protein